MPSFRRRSAGSPVPVVLYTRARCPLCDEMKSELARARPRAPFELREVDVDSDPRLARAYGRSVPVLEIAGEVAFEGRLTAAELERALARARSGGDQSPP